MSSFSQITPQPVSALGASVSITRDSKVLRTDDGGSAATVADILGLITQADLPGIPVLPNLTTTQKIAIVHLLPGMVVFDTTLRKMCVFNGFLWETVVSS